MLQTGPTRVLNNCSVVRDLRRYNARHDAILGVIASAVKEVLPPSTTLTVDIGDQYHFPLHIVPTDLRPDIVWWNDTEKSLNLLELTVCFESNFDDAAQRPNIMNCGSRLIKMAILPYYYLYKWGPEVSLTTKVLRGLPK